MVIYTFLNIRMAKYRTNTSSLSSKICFQWSNLLRKGRKVFFLYITDPFSRVKPAEPVWPRRCPAAAGNAKRSRMWFHAKCQNPGPLFRTVSELFAMKVENNMLCFFFISVFACFFCKNYHICHLLSICFSPQQHGGGSCSTLNRIRVLGYFS